MRGSCLLIILLFFLAFLTNCKKEKLPEKLPKDFLFIGSSLIGGVPRYIEEIAFQNGDSIEYSIRFGSGYSLKDHFYDEKTSKYINKKKWDIVLLQESSEKAGNDEET